MPLLPRPAAAAAAAALLLLTAAPPLARACTYFELRPQKEGVPYVIGNTNEWFAPMSARGWRALLHPRGEQYAASCGGGDAWTGRLGFVGMGGMPSATDGDNSLNEAGLAVSAHALRGVGSYAPGNATSARCAADFGAWVAGTFASVAELRAALPTVAVLFRGSGTTSSPGTQWAVADAAGDSIVIDYTDGALHVHDNRGAGVLTNDPEYSWQLRNLNNYVGLSMAWPGDISTVGTEVGAVPVAVGHGQNMLGLPGDLSPPARFVRTFFLKQYALQAAPPATVDDALIIATSVLNTQHIVKGMNARADGEAGYDYTQFGVMKVPSSGLFYYRTYEDMQWRLVNLTGVDWSRSGAAVPSGKGFAALDVTGEL